jgi:hypothetical protein
MNSANSITTKKAVWATIGFSEGVYLIAQNPNPVSVVCGVLLCSVSTLIIADAWRESAIDAAVLSVISFFAQQNRRVSALYTIYQMAPDIAAARENYLLNVGQGNQTAAQLSSSFGLKAPEANSDERTQMWRDMSQAQENQALVASVATQSRSMSSINQNRVQSKSNSRKSKNSTKSVVPFTAKIEYVSYADQNLKNLKLGLLTSDVYSHIQSESTLILTDIGSSEVGALQLKDFANNKLSLSFWIAKKTVGDCDLLVVGRSTLSQERDMLPRVLERLTADYKKVIVFVHAEIEQNIKGAFVPSSEQVIAAQTILE